MNTAMRPSSYLARETLVSALINGVISVGFFLLVFGGVDPVPAWGMGNYAFDFVPQSFAIGLMATLVPGLLCRKAITRGRIEGLVQTSAGSREIVASATFNAFLAVVFGAGLCALILLTLRVHTLPHNLAFVLKVLYGAVQGSLVTRFVLRRMMA